MEVKLVPELEAFVAESVKSGQYLSADDLLNAAVSYLRDQKQELSEEDERAIAEGEEAFANGDYMDFKTFAEELRKKDQPDPSW
jgi:putative addiction module CopG family antidote